jgi:DNA-binding transcriptional ArsR family regulator
MAVAINELEKILKSLANRRRLTLLAYLKHEQKMTVGNLAQKIQLSFQATSRHLTTLDRTGILEKDQRGLEVFYRLAGSARPFMEKLLTEL